MAIDALVKPLLHVPIFQGLKPLQVSEIARRADRIVYQPGQTVIEADKPGDAAILIVSGSAVRIGGAPHEQAPGEAVPEGALVGEMAMLIETEHSSTVVARSAVRALRITRQSMHEQMADDPNLADHFVQQIVSRLQALAHELRAIDGALAASIDTAAASAQQTAPIALRSLPPPVATTGLHS